MTTRTILSRSLRHYWRTHLGVVLGAALGAMVLTGALLVGDSVKATLRRQAMLRVGRASLAFIGNDRFFRDELAAQTHPQASPVMLLRATVSRADGKARVNTAQMLGVDERFWQLSPLGTVRALAADEVALNARLAGQLGVAAGDTVIIRLEKPSAFSRDAPLSGDEDAIVAIRARVARTVGDEDFGRFSLAASQVPPFSIFAPLATMQTKLSLSGRANLLVWPDPQVGKEIVAKTVQLPFTDKRITVWQKDLAFGLDGRKFALREQWQIEDASLELRPLPNAGGIELRTSRVFLDPPVVAAAPREVGGRARVDSLTYLVNELRAVDKAAPYSMVTAIDAPASGFLPAELASDEIAISQWLAEDLGVREGGKVTLKYFVMGERRKLVERAREFTVLAVIPQNEPQLNASWMPDFPGLADAKNCRDWQPGFDIDESKIRDKDEAYWDQYKGTPKAFLNIAVGQEMWGNRWGNLTSIRYAAAPASSSVSSPSSASALPAKSDAASDASADGARGKAARESDSPLAQTITAALKSKLTPEQLGFQFLPLREQALAATDAPVDFGQLFVSFSFFLLVAAAVLTGLLFVFSLEQRHAEAGLLLALGWRPRQVRRLFLAEGAALALVGALLGVGGAVLYTILVLKALATVWRGAVGAVEFQFSANPATIAIGVVSSMLIALLAMSLASRRQLRHSARELLTGEVGEERAETSPRLPSLPAVAQIAGAAHASAERKTDDVEAALSAANDEASKVDATVDVPPPSIPRSASIAPAQSGGVVTPQAARPPSSDRAASTTAVRGHAGWLAFLVPLLLAGAGALALFGGGSPGAFFGSGGLLLLGGSAFVLARLRSKAREGGGLESIAQLGTRNTARRRGRSLATVAVLACGVFMVVAVDAFRHGPPQNTGDRKSGTGGFALIGESALPIYEDLNTPKGREAFALDEKVMAGVSIVPMRVREGDDASCLNLNRALQPRILGVKPEDLASLHAFRFRGNIGPESWRFLERGRATDAVDPTVLGIADENTVRWALQKKPGDTLEYRDERGQPFRVKLTFMVIGSLLQGSVVVDEQRFVRQFPSSGGYRFFLIDAPAERMNEVAQELSRALADRGFEVTPAARRLAEFQAVENTYLSIFQALGGLGLLLGSAGLAIVVARNVLERRREFGLLSAVGFRPRQLRQLVFAEHRWLIVCGLGIGVASALLAVWPSLRERASGFPFAEMTLLLAALALGTLFWAWLATRLALRGSGVAALRSE